MGWGIDKGKTQVAIMGALCGLALAVLSGCSANSVLAEIQKQAGFANNTTPLTYMVTYNGNGNAGGTVPVDANKYTKGQTVTVLGNTGELVRSGYTFVGWNTVADRSGTTFAPGTTFTMGSANVVLYAMWTQNPTYTVTYNGNGNTSGAAPVDGNQYETAQTVTVLGNTGNLVKTGYGFVDWNTASDGSGTNYAAGATFPMGNASVTLYAVWKPVYSVSYNGNGATAGNVPVDSNVYLAGQTVTVLGNTGNLTETDNAFNGWNTQANGSGTPYSSGQTFPMGSADVTLYAQWTFLGYSITGTVYLNGSGFAGVTVSDGSASTTTNSSGAYTISGLKNGSYTVTPSESGYIFVPSSQSVTVNGADVSNVNFTGGVNTDGATIYAGTNDYGLSISTNGGATWTTYNTNYGLASDLVFGADVSGSTIYAATQGGLSVSTNGGGNWTNWTTTNGLAGNDVLDVYVSGSNIYAATNTGLSFSANGGANWSNFNQASGLGNSNVWGVYASGSTIYTATYGGGVSISNNNGGSWTTCTTAAGLGSNTVYKIYAVGSTIYAATDGGLSISNNSGASWTNYSTANGLGSNGVSDVYVSGSTIYAATGGGLSISTNGGGNWTTYTTASGLASDDVLGVYASGSIIYAATYAGLSISTNGGASWTNFTTAGGLAENDIRGVYAQ